MNCYECHDLMVVYYKFATWNKSLICEPCVSSTFVPGGGYSATADRRRVGLGSILMKGSN